MKILIGNDSLANPGGSETYAYTLAKELLNQGHAVECFTNKIGMVSDKLKMLGIPVGTKLQHKNYDVAFLSHTSIIAKTDKVKAFKIQTCHGIYPPLEQPVEGVDCYVSISEEVQTYLKKLGVDSTLIWNGIDCKRFAVENKIKREINETPKILLSLAQNEKVNQFLTSVCEELGIVFLQKNKYLKPIWEIEELIGLSDIVVTLGRGAYEAMASGRNVLLLDSRDYVGRGMIGDGLVTKGNILDFMKYNCSGRATNTAFTKEKTINEIKNYKQENSAFLRQFALESLNIEKQVQLYLNLIK